MSDVQEAALLDLAQEREAMAKRAAIFGKSDPAGREEIPAYVLERISRAIRFELDATSPISELKRELNMIRAEMTNCLVILDSSSSLSTRREMVYARLQDLRSHLHFQKKERKLQKTAQGIQLL